MKKEKYRKGIFLVVYKRNNEGWTEYLLLKRKLHWRGWEFPKGGIERGEKIRRAVLRELKEETGLNPLKITKHRKRDRYKYGSKLQDREGVTGQSYLLYSIKAGAGVVRIDKVEHSGSKWAGFEKAMRLLTWPNQRACLSIVNKSLKKLGF